MAEQSKKASRPNLERIEFCYPAPLGLPVPVKPRRGNANVLQQIQSLDWNSFLAS